MAAGSFSQPPSFPLAPGAVPSILNQSGSIPSTVLFTAPVSGLYLCSAACHIVSTNGVGTLTCTLFPSHFGGQTFNPSLGSGTPDGVRAAQPGWMNAGDQITVTVTAAGVTGTVFNIFVSISQVL